MLSRCFCKHQLILFHSKSLLLCSFKKGVCNLLCLYPMSVCVWEHFQNSCGSVNKHLHESSIPHGRKPKVVFSKFSTLSQAVFLAMKGYVQNVDTPTSSIENSPCFDQVFNIKLGCFSRNERICEECRHSHIQR